MDLRERDPAKKVQTALYRISVSTQTIEDLGIMYQTIPSIIAELVPAWKQCIPVDDESVVPLEFPHYNEKFAATRQLQKSGKGPIEYLLLGDMVVEHKHVEAALCGSEDRYQLQFEIPLLGFTFDHPQGVVNETCLLT